MIGIVTTFKDRSNYTNITYGTLTCALDKYIGDFEYDNNNGVQVFFYDDASAKPYPKSVTTLVRLLTEVNFKFYKNGKSLGAEWGNIDAITKCFGMFPEVTHVLVLDNDMCVHPYALHAVRKMIQDFPELGVGSIFNSNVFPEICSIKDRYVIKDVNPGLGAVIQREAWFWHLEQSKGKLDKNKKQPGWDWNLSAWMKDSGGRWNVYATQQSYLEHIGTSGTNVTENAMTRARRFRDQEEACVRKVEPIDILMPVKDLTPDALERMRWCIRSLCKNPEPFNLCVSDTSSTSMEGILKGVISIPFRYTYEQDKGLFNRSRTINNGVRELVRSAVFLVMDTDIIVPSNFLEKMMSYYNSNGNYVVGRMAYLLKNHPMTDDWEELKSYPVDFYYSSGFFICNLELFKRVNGMEEDYISWGAEDDSLNVRMGVATGDKIRKLIGMEMTCFHLYHPRKDKDNPAATERNRKLYWERKELFESGKLAPDAIKGLVNKSV